MPIQIEYHFVCNVCGKEGKIESYRYSRFSPSPIPALPKGWCHIDTNWSAVCCEDHIIEIRIDGKMSGGSPVKW